MFTPQEVSEKVFPKASFGGGGYNMASVDEFLDALTEDYTALFKDNVTLKAKLKVLAEKVEEYRSTEEAMRQALLTAQKMAAKLVQEAQTEKEKILSDARAEAQAEIRRLDGACSAWRDVPAHGGVFRGRGAGERSRGKARGLRPDRFRLRSADGSDKHPEQTPGRE